MDQAFFKTNNLILRSRSAPFYLPYPYDSILDPPARTSRLDSMLLSSLRLWTIALWILPVLRVSASMFEEMNSGALQMRGFTGMSEKYQGTKYEVLRLYIRDLG